MNRNDWIAIVVAGLVAGTLDIGAAALINVVSPVRILHFIAGGILGKAALAGGASIAFVGLLLQWAMSLIIAAVYVIASRWLRALRRSWLIAGLCYGVAVFFVMNYVVVPLSAWARIPTFTAVTFAANMAAMLVFGLIVAFSARHFVGSAEGYKQRVLA
jgi:hypothetical protein